MKIRRPGSHVGRSWAKRVVAVALLVAAALPSVVEAQSVSLTFRDQPLRAALERLEAEFGVVFVFADAVVEGARVSCDYVGSRPGEALTCLLTGTGLQAREAGANQFVIVRVEDKRRIARGAERRTLSGYVIDASSGEVLPGAHIFLPDRNRGATTNAAGYFALPALAVGPHQVRISFVGYAPADTTIIVGQGRVQIGLEPITFETDAVIVSESQTDAGLRPYPGVLEVPVNDLASLPSTFGGQDLFRSLEWLPGIQRTRGVAGGLSVRGGTPDRNLYLVDGAPVYHPWHAFGLVSTFQTETFKTVRMYRGVFPAEHGGRLSSVLDAELKDGKRPTPGASAAISSHSGRFLIESPITSRSSFMVSGRRSYIDKIVGRTHPVEDGAGRRDTLRTGYYFYDFTGKVSLRPDRRSAITFSYYKGLDDLDLRLPFDLSLDFSSWLKPADLAFEIGHRWGNSLYSVRYQHLLSQQLFLATTVYDSRHDARENTFIQPSISSLVDSKYGVSVRDIGVRTDVDYFRSIHHQIRFGAEIVQRRFESSLEATIERTASFTDQQSEMLDQTQLEYAAYGQDVWQVSGGFTISSGVRASVFGADGKLRVSPRLSAQLEPTDRLTLTAAASSEIQYLHRLRDRNSILYDLVSARWIAASDDVRPSRSYHLSAGVDAGPVPWLNVNLEGYAQRSDNILLPEDEFQRKDGIEGPGIELGALLSQYTPGKSRSYGAELSVTAHRQRWRILSAYTAARALDIAPRLGETEYRPARYDVPQFFSSTIKREGARWRFSASGVLRTGYPYSSPVSQYALEGPLGDDPTQFLHRPLVNNARLPAYARLDVGVTYRFDMTGAIWEAEILVFNATNRRNVVGREFDPSGSTVVSRNRTGIPLLPLVELRIAI